MFTPATRAAVVLLLIALFAAPRRSDAAPATPLPGSVGLVQKEVTLRNACAATFREIKKVKGGDDKAMVAALLVKRLTGLDFDPDKPAKVKASNKRMEDWMANLLKLYTPARKAQEAIFVDAAATPQAKVEALARMLILVEQAVKLLHGTEVPVWVRKYPEAATAFCDRMLEVAEPLENQVKEIRATCARTITEGQVGDGWWTSVCADP